MDRGELRQRIKEHKFNVFHGIATLVLMLVTTWQGCSIYQLDLLQKQARKTEAETQAQLQKNAVAGTPRIQVTPIVHQASNSGLRQLVIQIKLDNVGVVPVDITSVEIAVFRGTPGGSDHPNAEDVLTPLDAIHRAVNLHDLSLTRENYDRDEFERLWGDLHSKCPHGRIYSLQDDFVWEMLALPDRQLVSSKTTLPVGTQSGLESRFILTEYPYDRVDMWYRFSIQVSHLDAEGDSYNSTHEVTVPASLKFTNVISDERVYQVSKPVFGDSQAIAGNLPSLPTAGVQSMVGASASETEDHGEQLGTPFRFRGDEGEPERRTQVPFNPQ